MTKQLNPIARKALAAQADERLALLAGEGHEPAFEEIVRRYRGPLVAFATTIVAHHRAEDVVQASLQRAHEVLAAGESVDSVRAWLFTIVRNRALNALRDDPEWSELSVDVDGAAQPPAIVEEREELERVIDAICALPEAQRQAIVMRAVEGEGHAEIAARLHTSPTSVRGLIFRARRTLRSSVGALIPLPLMRWLLGGATAAAGGGAAAGAGVALGGGAKLAVAISVAAVTIGAGAALRDRPVEDEARAAGGSERPSSEANGGGSGSGPSSGSESSGAEAAELREERRERAEEERERAEERAEEARERRAERREEARDRAEDAREEAADAAEEQREAEQEAREEEAEAAEEQQEAAAEAAQEQQEAAAEEAEEAAEQQEEAAEEAAEAAEDAAEEDSSGEG